MPIVQNKPNFAERPEMGASGGGQQAPPSKRCKTKPIRRRPHGVRGMKCAKRTQFRRSAGPWRQKSAKQSQTWAGWDTWGTAHPEGANRAKQSQFAAGWTPHHSIVPSFQYSKPTPIVRNKPNLPQTGREDHRQGRRPWRCHPAEGNCVKTRGTRQAGFRAQGLAHFPGIW